MLGTKTLSKTGIIYSRMLSTIFFIYRTSSSIKNFLLDLYPRPINELHSVRQVLSNVLFGLSNIFEARTLTPILTTGTPHCIVSSFQCVTSSEWFDHGFPNHVSPSIGYLIYFNNFRYLFFSDEPSIKLYTFTQVKQKSVSYVFINGHLQFI